MKEYCQTPTNRKLLYVPMLHASDEIGKTALTGLTTLYGKGFMNDYNNAVFNHWKKIDERIKEERNKHVIDKLYLETITFDGERGLKQLKGLISGGSFVGTISDSLIKEGSTLVRTECEKYVNEMKKLMAVFAQKLLVENGSVEKLKEDLVIYAKKRDQYIKESIEKTLKSNEVGILFVGRRHKVEVENIEIKYLTTGEEWLKVLLDVGIVVEEE